MKAPLYLRATKSVVDEDALFGLSKDPPVVERAGPFGPIQDPAIVTRANSEPVLLERLHEFEGRTPIRLPIEQEPRTNSCRALLETT